MIPQTKFVQGGPPVTANPGNSASRATAAMATIGDAIQHLGEKGQQIYQAAREADEAKKVSGFLLGMDKEAADFSNELMRRSDTENWGDEWKQKIESSRSQLNDLNLSPVMRDRMNLKFDQWASDRSIGFEAQVAQRSIMEGRAQVAQAVQYHVERGEFDAAREQADLLKGTGVGDAEMEKVEREIERSEAMYEIGQVTESNPKTALESLNDPDFIKNTPGVTLADVEREKQRAERNIQERREQEFDVLETKYFDGTLQDGEIDSATYLTDKDKRGLKSSINSNRVPSNEEHAEAWKSLDTLRAAREDPSVSDTEYRKAFNEARASVLGSVPPNYQGDIKKELNYLSPAGRSPDGVGGGGGYTTEDIQAIGRSVIFSARDMNQFGDVEDEKSKGEAFTKAERLRVEFNRWSRSDAGKAATPAEAEAYAAGLATGQTTTSAAKKFSQSVPSAGQRLKILMPKGMPDVELPLGPGSSSSDLLPPRERLEERLK